MGNFIVRRFGQAVITLLAMTLIVFLLARASGDPADTLLPAEATREHRARMMELWGLDQPVHVQYGRFLMNALRGDFGLALMNPGREVLDLVLERVRPTIELAVVAMLGAVALSLVIGVFSAVYKDSPFDTGGKILAILGQSMPHFWIGIILMWVFAVHFGWLPTSGYGTWRHFVMPAIVVGWFQVSALMRLLRSGMLEALDSEYVQLARVKGVSQASIVWKHCLRNAAIAPLTYAGIMLSYLVVGSITTEIVFNWPGVGALVYRAILARDFAVVQAIAIVFGVMIIFTQFVVDILYGFIDPRIRYGK
jgi:peptide/nickel transport system permease protein